MGHPSVYPSGATIYNPDKCWNGFTIFQANTKGALLIDMNGNELHLWRDLQGFPNKILPGGFVMGSRAKRDVRYGFQDQTDLVQVDFDGNIVWKFDKAELIEDPGHEPTWMARQHHDYQREGSTTGYYAPGAEAKTDSGNTLVLSHRNVKNPYISEHALLDDVIYEVNWKGEIIWEWLCSDHVEEMGFDEVARNALARSPNRKAGGFSAGGPDVGDWMHVNSMSVLGPNRWYDQGDERFHPDNIIIDGRETNIILILSKKTGKIVWQLGPDYSRTPELRKMGWIIGQHHAHMIPRGLPGEGNILVFDNGGWAGYGAPNPSAPIGGKNALRDYSRILEIDPTTLEVVWQCNAKSLGYMMPMDAFRFYSPYISSAQRLPNGNTMICEGAAGRFLEVTKDFELVWEYVSPHWGTGGRYINMVYRSYRLPYEWVPQLPKPKEVAIPRIDVTTWRVPGAGKPGFQKEVRVEGTEEPDDKMG